MKKQVPSAEDNWLYKDENDTRIFSKEIYLPEEEPFWLECTNAEKEKWEEEHGYYVEINRPS